MCMCVSAIETCYPFTHNFVSPISLPFLELMDSLTQLRKNSSLPDENELKGAVLGLARLQDIYDIDADDMANGKGYG